MRRTALTLALILLCAPLAPAQDWAQAKVEKSPRHREWVTVKHGDRAVETFVVYPESASKTPVVLVIHEIFGMTDWVQDLVDQVAEAGYIAVAPDLLSGMGPNGGRTKDFPQGQATEAVSHLNPDQITADLNAVADYALKLPAANGKLFVAGFCWGGGISFAHAAHAGTSPQFGASVVYYGTPPSADQLPNVHAPVLGLYGGTDARIALTVPGTDSAMKALGRTYEHTIFAGAAHGFLRAQTQEDGSIMRANLDATKQAWPMTIAWFRKYLR